MTKLILSLINKRNFELNSRSEESIALIAPGRRATKKLAKISLPEGNLAFAQSLRYVSSGYAYTPSSTCLDFGQNQDFNLVRILI
jgi:hypothetical protein